MGTTFAFVVNLPLPFSREQAKKTIISDIVMQIVRNRNHSLMYSFIKALLFIFG